jgi:hypothetical protein
VAGVGLCPVHQFHVGVQVMLVLGLKNFVRINTDPRGLHHMCGKFH